MMKTRSKVLAASFATVMALTMMAGTAFACTDAGGWGHDKNNFWTGGGPVCGDKGNYSWWQGGWGYNDWCNGNWGYSNWDCNWGYDWGNKSQETTNSSQVCNSGSNASETTWYEGSVEVIGTESKEETNNVVITISTEENSSASDTTSDTTSNSTSESTSDTTSDSTTDSKSETTTSSTSDSKSDSNKPSKTSSSSSSSSKSSTTSGSNSTPNTGVVSHALLFGFSAFALGTGSVVLKKKEEELSI